MHSLDRRHATPLDGLARSARRAAIAVALTLLAASAASLAAAPVASAASPAASARASKPALALGTHAGGSGAIELRWQLRAPLRRVSLRVNGRVVRSRALALRRGQRVRYALGAAERVRFGRNTLVVIARARDGRRQVLRRTVVVRRDAPLVGVRRAAAAVAGRATRLDGRSSRPAHGGRLRYRWQVVRAPRGARATLRDADGARPRLIASVPGRYHVALTVTERGVRRTAGRATAAQASDAAQPAAQPGTAAARPAAAQPAADDAAATATSAACAIAPTAVPSAGAPTSANGSATTSTPTAQLGPRALTIVQPQAARPAAPAGPPATRASAGCATAVATVDVLPNDAALGVAFDARVTQAGTTGVRVGTSLYALPQSGALLLLLDAQTLELLYQWSDPSPTPLLNAQVFAATYAQQGHDVLIVSAGLPGCCSSAAKGVSPAGWTVVQPYVAGGNAPATQNLGLPLTTGGPGGRMTGWLQPGIPLDGAPALYTFVSPERVPFSTRASGSTATSNTMQLDGSSYTSALPAGASAGYQLLVTDATLTPVLGTPAVFGTNGPDAAGQEQALAALLTSALELPGATVLLQSIARPRPASPASAQIAQLLQQLGGSAWMWLSQDGSGDYALVGNADLGQPGLSATAAEASEQWTTAASGGVGAGRGSLQGMLRRRDDSAWAPTLADAIGTPDYGLAQVVYQSPTPWPQTDTAGKVAATTWMAQQLDLQVGPGSCWQPSVPDFRSSYCNDALDPDATEDQLSRLSFPGKSAGFSKAEFKAVRGQLETELDDLGQVRALFSALQQPFGAPGVDPAVDAQQIAGEIVAAIPPPRQSATSGDLELASSILYVGAEVPEVGEALGPIAAILDLASELTQDNGQPSPDWGVQTAADQIGATVRDRLQAMSGSLGSTEDVFVSDWGKLSTAAADALGAWGVSSTGIANEESTLQLGIEQWMWTAIAPAAFDLVGIPGAPQQNTGDNIWCVTSSAPEADYPWHGADQRSLLFPLGGFSGGAATSAAMIGLLSGSYSSRGPTPVSSTLADQMFKAPGQGGAGLLAPWLLNRADWTIETPTIAQPTTSLKPGVCGLGKW